MSSPGARQRRRRDQYQAPRTRNELMVAVGIGVAIVAATALMIWLLRPGGLADRQPRSSWLVALALLAAVVAVWLILKNAQKRELNSPLWIGGSLAGIAVVAVIAGIAWPSGLLRHTPPPITVPTNTTTPTNPSTPSASTTAPAGASTTQPGSSTTNPATATTTATTTAPTSSGP